MPYNATEQDFQKLEVLIESGKSPEESAKIIGVPLRSFSRNNSDPVRFAELVERSEDIRKGLVDEVMDRDATKPDAPAALKNKWAEANHPERYGSKTQVEISGRVQHEHQGVFAVADLIAVARERGLLEQLADRPLRAIPATREILPDPAERAPGALPTAESS